MLHGDVLFINSDNEIRLSNLRTLDGDVQATATVTYAINAADGTLIQGPTAMAPDPTALGDYAANFDAVSTDISAYELAELEVLLVAVAGPQLRREWRVPAEVRYSGRPTPPPWAA